MTEKPAQMKEEPKDLPPIEFCPNRDEEGRKHYLKSFIRKKIIGNCEQAKVTARSQGHRKNEHFCHLTENQKLKKYFFPQR